MNKNKRKICWKNGSSMIEIIVAFLIVTMTVVSFNKVVSSSAVIFNKSRQVLQQTEAFDTEFYKTNIEKKDVSGTISLEINNQTINLDQAEVKKVSSNNLYRYTIEVKE